MMHFRRNLELVVCQYNNKFFITHVCRVPQYMGFGLSGSSTATSMDNADVTITWIGNNGQPNAVDYFLRSRTQVL